MTDDITSTFGSASRISVANTPPIRMNGAVSFDRPTWVSRIGEKGYATSSYKYLLDDRIRVPFDSLRRPALNESR